MVDLVRVAHILITHEDWSRGTILPVLVCSDKAKLSEVLVVAEPSIPSILVLTVIKALRDSRSVSNNCNMSVSEGWPNVARVRGLLEVQNYIRWGSAGETNTIINVVPTW